MSRIFVIDDEAALGENIQRMLRLPATTVSVFQDPVRGLEECLSNPPDLVLLDMRMPGMSGEEVFARLHETLPGLPVIFLTAFGSVEGAVVAMRNGAFDYLQKPFKREDLLLVVKRALSHATLEQEVQRLKGRLEALGETDAPQTRSPAMLEQTDKCRRAAATDATVMILGDSGTGKEVMARFIHDQSRRKDGPFVPVECSAMPGSLIESELFGHERGAFTGAERTKKGLIESADGGTLFLDEIAELPPEQQIKLLSVLEAKQVRRVGESKGRAVDFRLLAATNQDLRLLVQQGRFRPELYYRLNVIRLAIPPLRERRELIDRLALRFIAEIGAAAGRALQLAPEALPLLHAYPWPGNIRELRHAIERAVASTAGELVGPEDFELEDSLTMPAGRPVVAGEGKPIAGTWQAGEITREQLMAALLEHGGNRTRTGKALGRSREWLRQKCIELGIPLGR